MNDYSYNIKVIYEWRFIFMSNIPNDKTLDKMESLLNIASDYTRLKIMYCIQNERKSVSEIVNEIEASQSLVSHQLSVLKKSHLVTSQKEGKKVYYLLDDEHVVKLLKIVFEHVMEEK